MSRFNRTEIPSSFRDPGGSLFAKGGTIYRNVNYCYKEHYDCAKESGLYEALIGSGLLVPHREIKLNSPKRREVYKIISPEKIPFISYPYEWSFSQLKDAALLTLEVQKKALDHNMILKDASAFNVQFWHGQPMFIDTLSFENYIEGSPWVGYRQFCQHFLAPLALMSYRDLRMNQFFRVFIDGVPLDLAASMLPMRTLFHPLVVSHLHLHAMGQKRFSANKAMPHWSIPRQNLIALIDSLKSAVDGLLLKNQRTEWQSYYEETNYSVEAFSEKTEAVSGFLSTANPKTVWDFGANTGKFSRLASDRGIETVSFDIDPKAVEENYLEVKKRKEKNLLPLLLDLTNPSPAVGWANQERMSLESRGGADVVLALALVHHLAISNGVPFGKIAEYFSRLCKNLIVEFVPKTDSQVGRLLATRRDVFPAYCEEEFEKKFGKHFSIKGKKRLADSERLIYLMKKISA